MAGSGGLQDYANAQAVAAAQASNPAAPTGVQQMAQGTTNKGPGAGASGLQQYLADQGSSYSEMAQSWYTGANAQGTNNGWDTGFVESYTKQWGEAAENGQLRTFFDRDNVTGVVTWDHDSEVSDRTYKFGDVYEDGKLTGNLYDIHDKDTANLMMAPWLLDAKTQAETFSSSDRMERLDREISNTRSDRNENFVKSLDAMEFQQDVDKRQADIQGGFGDELLGIAGAVGGGALGGGAAGALGANPLTIAGGALIGGVAGGAGAWLNRDNLSEQAARAIEITNMSYEEFGLSGAAPTAVAQWSGVASRLITPTSNLTQGIYDATEGKGGDGQAEFYSTDETGKNTAPMWVRGVDVAATVADSLIQFGSGVGIAMYTGQMSGTILGETGGLIGSGGNSFDYRRGGFDNIFKDDDGNADFSSGAAGILKIGIDVVQLGMARGLAGSTNAARAEVGEDAAYAGVGTLGKGLPLWMGGSRGLAAGEERVRAGGFSFTRAADGSIVDGSRRGTLGMLAPSEAISALSTRAVAQRVAAQRGGALAADDFYRAAQSLATGERRMTGALLNAYGEGMEEAVQAVLEPHSHGGSATGSEIVNAAIYGAASGLGMGIGTSLRAPTADRRMSEMAYVAHVQQTGEEMSTGEWADRWASMDDLAKRQAASMSGATEVVAKAAFQRVAESMQTEQAAGTAGIHKVEDAIQTALGVDLGRANTGTDQAFVISALEEVPRVDQDGNALPGYIPVNGIVGSARQTALNIAAHQRGLAEHAATIVRTIEELEARSATGDEVIDADTAEQLAVQTRLLATTELSIEMGRLLDVAIDTSLDRINDVNGSVDTVRADVEQLNQILRAAYNMELDSLPANREGTQMYPLTDQDKIALARSVSLVFGRDPFDSSGSIQTLIPQVSAQLTLAGTDNFLLTSHAILPAISGDYDGDKVRQQALLIMRDEVFASQRVGDNLLGTGAGVNIAAPKWERHNVEQLSRSLLPDANENLRIAAMGTLTDIATAVRNRYDGLIDNRTLDPIFRDFFAAVRSNDKDAREKLINGLADTAGSQIRERARRSLTNEWFWLDQLIVGKMQAFQEVYASHRPDSGLQPDTSTVAVNVQEPNVRTRAAEPAATPGQTLAQLAPGDSLFRKFQKLHYAAINSPALRLLGMEASGLEEMQQDYRTLRESVTKNELEVLRGKDEITNVVFAQLMRLADSAVDMFPQLNRYEAITVMANLAVEDFAVLPDGSVQEIRTAKGEKQVITLAQMLLKQSLVADRRQKDAIFESSPELQAKHATLNRMTRPNSRDYPDGAEATFVEVFGAQQMYTLLGDASELLGPQLTVEQFVRRYTALHENDRAELAKSLRSSAAYLGKKQQKDMPYSLEELLDDNGNVQISPMRSVVDALVEVGNRRIAINRKKVGGSLTERHLTGRLADRSYRTGDQFREGHTLVRRALQDMLDLSPREEGELTIDVVARLLETNPSFAKQIMALIPNSAASVAFKVNENGSVNVANWLYETFMMEDSTVAEMHYYRNLLLTTWHSKVNGHMNEDSAFDGQQSMEYERLDSRMHKLIYQLNHRGDNGLMLQKFFSELERSTNLESFFRWVNTAPGVRNEQAPFTPWVDDVAEFDMDKAQGGWTTALTGAELREAIATLRDRSQALVKDLTLEKAAARDDVRITAAIDRVLRREGYTDTDGTVVPGDPNVVLLDDDRKLHARFVESIEVAGRRATSLGSAAMIEQSFGAVWGLYTLAHVKGSVPPNVAPLGLFDAQRDAFGYVTNYRRMTASLTTVDLDAVSGNLSEVAKDAGRTMDDFGRTIEWTSPSPKEMLDLLRNPDTKPYARAILFPQVMERTLDGQLSTQMLVGKSLSDLLLGNSYRSLFSIGDSLSQEAAFKYNSLLEGAARNFNGHYSLQRAVNDIAIARTANADRELTRSDVERIVTRTYSEVARIMQDVGAIYNDPSGQGKERLVELYQVVREGQRTRYMRKIFGDTDETIATSLNILLQRRVAERDARLAAFAENSNPADPVSVALLEDQVAAETAEFDRFVEMTERMQRDDVVQDIVDKFRFDATQDSASQRAQKQGLVEYVSQNLEMLHRIPTIKLELLKLTSQVRDSGLSGQILLEDKEWLAISNGVIGHYLDNALQSYGASITIPPFPDADREQDHKYYDKSFSYLVKELMNPDGPLALAAREVHKASGRLEVVSTDEFIDRLGRTVFDEKRLGPWTSVIRDASMEANNRIDSAAAGPAISIAGMSPKTESAVAAATRRPTSMPVPDESLLSVAKISVDGFDQAQSLAFIPSWGTGLIPMPAQQLNNRFARSVVLKARDGSGARVEIDLLAEYPDLGRPWTRNQAVAESGYYEIHNTRIQRAIEAARTTHGLDLTRAGVEIEFFHPDSQPSTPEHANSIYFEGTNFTLDADNFDSLLAGLWFSGGGISQAAQRSALDASKLGLPALQVIDVATSDERRAIEADWTRDMAGMILAKTQVVMNKDLGFGVLDGDMFNAVYKDMKVRHYVLGTSETGEQELWTAERVIEHQRTQPGVPLPLTDAQLWVPSDKVLRTMMGEQGTQGADRVSGEELNVDPSLIPIFRGDTSRIAREFREGVAGETVRLEESRAVHRSFQTQATWRTMLTDESRTAFEQKMAYFRELESGIIADRSTLQTGQAGAFSAPRTLKAAVERADMVINAENLSVSFASIGLPFGPRSNEDIEASRVLLRDLHSMLETDQYRAGFIYREGSVSKPMIGEISEVSLDGAGTKGFSIAPKDLVVVEIDSFNGDVELAKQRLDYIANRGAYIVLGATNGQTDLKILLATHLESNRGYERVNGSPSAYAPAEYNTRFQNQRARASTLLETRGISARNRIVTLSVRGLGIHEGAGWINGNDEHLGAIGTVVNLVPAGAFAQYGVPVESLNGTTSQIEEVRQHLRSLNNESGMAVLLASTLGDVNGNGLQGDERADAEIVFRKSWDRLMQRFDSTPGVVLPQAGDVFGPGDLIPLVRNVGGERRVILYRHGFKAPTMRDIEIQHTMTRANGTDALNVAVYTSVPETNASVHEGTVVQFDTRTGFGLNVELNINHSAFGDKFQLEGEGMKYVTTPMPASIVLPEHGLFEFQGKQRGISIVDDIDTRLGKEAVNTMIDNFRNAFAFFGVDFTNDITEFFFPGSGADPKTQGEARVKTMEMLRYLETRAPRLGITEVHELLNLDRLGAAFAEAIPPELRTAVPGIGEGWVERLSDLSDPKTKIASAIILYTLLPGARAQDVLRSGRLDAARTSEADQSRLMPSIFTQVFDNAPAGSPLRQLMFQRFNEQFYNPNTDGTGYMIFENFEVEVRGGAAENRLRGILSMPEVHSSGDNPVKNGMTFHEYERGSLSQHNSAMLGSALGTQSAYTFDITRARAFARSALSEVNTKDLFDGGLWRMLTSVPEKDKSFEKLRSLTVMEAVYEDEIREKMLEFRVALNKLPDYGWTEGDINEYETTARRIVETLGLMAEQSEVVDYWVRQYLGQPESKNLGENQGNVTSRDAKQALEWILQNVEEGYMPTFGAMQPQIHIHDLQAIYRANRANTRWAPRINIGGTNELAASWDDWVNVALGSAIQTDEVFDWAFLKALDGHVRGYQNATRSTADLPVSTSVLRNNLLMDPNNQSVVSIDPDQQVRITENLQVASARASLDEVLGGKTRSGPDAPTSALARRRAIMKKWRKDNDIPVPVATSMRNLRTNGVAMIDQGTNTSALVRALINIRVSTALINPALWVSAGPELFVRSSLDRVANAMTGQSLGFTGKMLAGRSDKADEAFEMERDLKIEGLRIDLKNAKTEAERSTLRDQIQAAIYEVSTRERLGLTTRYTRNEIDQINSTAEILGQRRAFKGMVQSEVNFLQHSPTEIGRLEQVTAKVARFGSSLQDPTYGVRAKSLGRRYLEAVLQDMLATPTINPITVPRLMAELKQNPTYVRDNYPQAHKAGVNNIANIRSIKQTTASVFLRSMYEPMTESNNAFTNNLSNVVLKIPMLFANYGLNVATTITGMQGFSDATAMWAHGRKKGPKNLFGRLQAAVKGDEYNPGTAPTIDMSEVLDGIDLSRSFLRGALTHTGLFTAAMLAGGMNLSGEDPEMKRRRLLAKHQGVGHLYDPMKIEADFRNADAIYGDWLPFSDGGPFQPHWMLRQFISPVLGMEKFFETGDFRHIGWGFEDALLSFPLINTASWRDAHETANMLANQADDEAAKGPGFFGVSSNLLTGAVGTYERMLFENAFVNQLYVGMDRYDRDPYVLPLIDSDGDMQKDIEGNTRKQDIALRTFINDEGEMQQGFLGRDGWGTELRELTENRATLGFITSFLPGLGNSSNWRYNMPIKTRTFDKPDQNVDEIKAQLLVAFQAFNAEAGGVPALTIEEAEVVIRNDIYETEGYWAPDNIVMPKAEALIKNDAAALLSYTDEQGKEHLTDQGRRAIVDGLAAGSVSLDSPALTGVYMTFEQREKLTNELYKDIQAEGLRYGLDDTKANKRADRILNGWSVDGVSYTGLSDIIWSDKISYDDKVTYGQLNTTYVPGPDGRMWATGFERGKLMSALGLSMGNNPIAPIDGVTDVDARGNTVDLVNGMNTGLRALVPLEDSRNVPTDKEIGDAIIKAIENIETGAPAPFEPFASTSGGGYGGWGGYGGYGGYGGGGGGGGGGSAYFVRLNAFPRGMVPYGHNAPYINTSNPIIRRADVRRERVWSERGRLKQWQ